jgi:inosine-uridine nucleoside N-ribohydrolase
VRLWIDTDIGDNPDDAIALLCAVAHPDIELVGVSTVDGDVERRAETARALVGAVPVCAGPPPADLGGAEVVLLIGPWTHGAEIVVRGGFSGRIAAMGGARRPVFHRGVLQVVEHNVGADPAAARTLLDHGVRVLVVPLDVTATVVCSRAEEQQIVDNRPDLDEAIAQWRHDAGDVPLCLHDALALLALMGAPRIDIASVPLSVGHHGVMHSRGYEHDVVVGADRHAVVARVLTLLG